MTALEKEMVSIVERYHSSSLTQLEFSIKNNISKGKLHYWIKKLSESSQEKTPSGFIPLELPELPKKESKYIIIRMSDGMVKWSGPLGPLFIFS